MTGDQPEESFKEHRPLGATEAEVVLSSLGAIYAAFAIVQLMKGLGHNDLIAQNQGLTYAEHWRSGFFSSCGSLD